MGKLFDITPEIIQTYQDGIDDIIDQLGRIISVSMKPKLVDCPNCGWDSFRKRSNNRYQAGGPKPFTDGQQCPYCYGKGKLNNVRNVEFKATVAWNPKDFEPFTQGSVETPRTIVKTKTYIWFRDHIEKCEHAIIEDIVCKLIKKPIPRGLQESRYVVAYWEVINK